MPGWLSIISYPMPARGIIIIIIVKYICIYVYIYIWISSFYRDWGAASVQEIKNKNFDLFDLIFSDCWKIHVLSEYKT